MLSKRNLFLLLSLIICLGSYSQSKLINAGKTGKVSGTVKTETSKSKTFSAGPRFSTNPSRKNLSLYFVPKIGYGQIEDYGAGGLSYEMELGLNFGRNLFVSYSYTGESTYIDYYEFEEDFNFSAHSIRFGIYF